MGAHRLGEVLMIRAGRGMCAAVLSRTKLDPVGERRLPTVAVPRCGAV